MKNKSNTNDSYIKNIIKESIIFNTKKQNLMRDFEVEIRKFERKLSDNQDFNEMNRILKQFEDYMHNFQIEVKRMVRESHMFEHRPKRALVEDARFVLENFPNYKRFIYRFLNCENSKDCLSLTNRFINDEFEPFTISMKREIKKQIEKKDSERIEFKLRDVPSLLNSMSNRSDFRDRVLSIMANIVSPASLRKSPPNNIYIVLMYIIQKYDNLLGSSINIKKISNGRFVLRINHPKAHQVILDVNKQEVYEA